MKKTYVKPEISSLSFGSGEVMKSGLNTASIVLQDDGIEEDRGPWSWEDDVDQASKGNGLWDDDEWDD